ncbi:MAG TPA: hypothetical protein PLH36_14785, partial [Armatimonadota bacterium]|nr:hypothetical protein [Armatimonadota bacterium]
SLPNCHPRVAEFQNMLTVSRLIARAALKREESRGGHYRTDFPRRDDEKWRRHVVFRGDVTEVRERLVGDSW